MNKEYCFYKKCVFRKKVDDGLYFCPFPSCFIDSERKRWEARKNERAKQDLLSKERDS